MNIFNRGHNDVDPPYCFRAAICSKSIPVLTDYLNDSEN